MADNISLKVKAQNLTNFSYMFVNHSMVNFGPEFLLSSAFGQYTDWQMKIDDAATLELEGTKIIDGYINSCDVSIPSNGRPTIDITGYDKTKLILDSSYDGSSKEWKNQSLSSIIKAICGFFNIDVTEDSSVSSDLSSTLVTYKIDDGQKAFYHIANLCYAHGILPISLVDGKLTLTRAGHEFINDTIEIGRNAISGVVYANNKNRYSKYIVKGQGIGNDSKSIKDWAQATGSFSDNGVNVSKSIINFFDLAIDNGGCGNLAQWLGIIQAGLSRRQVYTVKDWVDGNGDLWEVNKLITVKNDIMNINTTMLIIDIDFIQEGNNKSIITLVDPNIFSFSDTTIPRSTVFD
jgi:prophage tail gpP-like protein